MRILQWFRKDLRLDDNAALHEAVRDASGDVVPFYASDPAILGRDDLAGTRVRFVLESLADLDAAIRDLGSRLALDHGDPEMVVPRAARACGADAVYWNDEYEPALVRRDDAVERALRAAGVKVRRFHDRLLVPPGAVATGEGRPFVVYTPFRRACERVPVGRPFPAPARLAPHDLPVRAPATLARLGFATDQERWPGGATAARARLQRFVAGAAADEPRGLAIYMAGRDRPGADATSRLSADLRFGTLSPRTIVHAVRAALAANRAHADDAEKYVAELRWRDFYAHVLFHFPHAEQGAFRTAFDGLRWDDDPRLLDAWREGRTGVPIVDAGMRELRRTGFMHNRVRMVAASFLVKSLLLDWRLGERHFMRHLVDGDLASNNGGWQWTASTGTDAQPWFRVFNPVLQGTRFDADGAYVRRWVPELVRVPARWIHAPWEAPLPELAGAGVTLGGDYPAPIVDLRASRERALARYQAVARAALGAQAAPRARAARARA